MKTLQIILICFLYPLLLNAQSIGVWENYTNLQNVSQSAAVQNGFWAATDGGAFKYDKSDNSFIKLTKAGGLSSHSLTTLAIDNEGKIWFGSTEGIINIYNPSTGLVKKILDIYNSDMNQKQINNISISNDSVFVSTSFGLSIINATDYTFIDTIIKFGQFAAETKVNSIFKTDLIYICTENGIAAQKPGTTNLTAPESWQNYELSNAAKEIVRYNGTLYLATSGGLLSFDSNNWKQFLLPDSEIVDLQLFNGLIYILLKDQVYTYDGSSLISIFQITDVELNSIAIGDSNEIWVSSDLGVFDLTSSDIKIFPNSPLANSFMSITVDNESNVWVGSGDDAGGVGIFKYDGIEWTNFNVSSNPELQTNAFHLTYTAPDNSVYFGNWGNGFTTLDNDIFTTYNSSNTDMVGIPADPDFIVISGIKEDSDGNTWLVNFWSANSKPLALLTTESTWHFFEFISPRITSNEIVEHLVIDQYDTKWFAVTDGDEGLYYFNENNTPDITGDDDYGYLSTPDLMSNLITALAVDNRGELWVGTNIGVNIISNPSNPTSRITEVTALQQQSINCITVDPLNHKWIGTNKGVYVLSSDGIRVLDSYDSKNSPLPSNDITSIAIDPATGIVYIGTNFGMASLTTEAMEPSDSFTELFVYPNPFIIGETSANQLTIDGLIKDSELKIISLTGQLVTSFEAAGGRVAFWDGRDMNNKYVASGIYFIVAYDEEASNVTTSKVAVIRR